MATGGGSFALRYLPLESAPQRETLPRASLVCASSFLTHTASVAFSFLSKRTTFLSASLRCAWGHRQMHATFPCSRQFRWKAAQRQVSLVEHNSSIVFEVYRVEQ